MPQRVDLSDLYVSNEGLEQRLAELGYGNVSAVRQKDTNNGTVHVEIGASSHTVEVLFDPAYGTEEEAWDRAYKYLADNFAEFVESAA